MTLRERFNAVFRGEQPDAMAFFGDMTYWYAAHRTLGDLPEAWQGERGIGQLHRDLRVGEYVPGCCAFTQAEGETVRCEGYRDADIWTQEWHTPVGMLRQRRQYSSASFSAGYIEHAVKDVEDLKILRYIMERRTYAPATEAVTRVEEDYGDYGVSIVAVPGSPLTEMNKTWMGVMDLCYLLADEREEMLKTLAVIGESQDRLYAITEACACPYVMICENLTAETMGGYFDEFIGPYLTARTAGLHAHGKQAIIHIDGTLRGVVERIPATGIDAIDAMTPAPVGDVSIAEIRDLVGEELIILGGLPGAMFAPPFTAGEMEAHVREIIRHHKERGRFIFGVADQVPPNGDLRLVKLVSEMVEELGRY
jgi:uroporphyrinogen-III decarboxylase